MGSARSKDAAAAASASSSSTSGVRKGRSRVFHSSCFGLAFALSDDHLKEEESGMSKYNARPDEAESKSNGGDREHSRTLELSQPSKLPCLTCSDGEQSGGYQDGASQVALGASSDSSTTVADIGQSSNTSGRSRSRFSFISDGISFRLNRAVSLGSSGAHSLLSAGLSVPNCDQGEHVIPDLDSSLDNRCDTQVSTTAEASTSQDVAGNNARLEATINRRSHRDLLDHDRIETRHSRRRIGPQEHLEGSVRFSRTRSVGRLRDRVLRRTPFTEGLFGSVLLEDRSLGSFAQANVRRVLGGVRGATSFSNWGNEVLPDYSSDNSHPINNSMVRNDNHASETPESREATVRDILEHRSAFLERRRRIRSQVRALQRLGSRFENLSGHDRSCILSGQHRTGRCTCRTGNRAANPEEDTSTRASISRIVMLAEALFEVLDEIHQQSVILSSRPSFSSIGSVPAPKEVVECMPLKSFIKLQKNQNEDAAQCYICLVEYEDGDCMRILPCNHEFHRTCIDKWLKEIHRVCPLCRGDVCRSDASGTGKLS